MFREDHNDNNAYQKSSLILFQDCSLCVFASVLALLLVRWVSDPEWGFTILALKWAGCSLVASFAGIFISGSHKVVRRYATVKSSVRLIWAVSIKEIILLGVVLVGLVNFKEPVQKVLLIIGDTFFSSVILLYIRFVARFFSGSDKASVKEVVSRKNALVLGTEADSVTLADSIASEHAYNVLGYITANKSLAGRLIGDREVYYCTTPEELEALEWKLGGIDCVFLTKGATGSDMLQKFDSSSDGQNAEIEDTAESEPVPDRVSLFTRFVKRSFDAVLAGMLMLIFSPLALIVAVAIRIEDGEPIFYKQERVGLNGKTFNILKFRSMRPDAEAAGAQLYSGDNDPRLTRVGAFIRKHHLDELPQLWNVFVGDMSFVGYRPERPFYIRKIMEKNPRYRYLYQIRPGVTSYATLYNGYTDTLEKMLTRLDLDLYYLRHHSVFFDFKVLGLTFLNIVGGKKF